VAESWFTVEGDGLRSTGVASTPHAPNSQHGAAVAALAARAIDATPSPVPMEIVRLTVDLTRRVPLGLVTVETNVRRDGMRVQLVEAIVSVDGEPRSRSEALRIRSGQQLDPADLVFPDDVHRLDLASHLSDSPWPDSALMRGIECSFEWWQPGRGVYWIRVSDQLVAGEVMTPATRAAVASDLVMTAGGVLPDHMTVNADISLSMNRPPIGEWIRIESQVRLNSGGWGSTEGKLWDLHGRFGTATKSILVGDRHASGRTK
jgi:hypothetical protein